MWAHTKEHHTEEPIHTKEKKTKTQTSSKQRKHWRDFFGEELELYSEQGLYLKGLRLREGYTQKQLGDILGMSPNNISAIEHGARSIGKALAHKLAKFFSVDYRRFL